MSVALTPPCPDCIWQYGLPDLARSSVIDEKGQSWQLGTFVKDDSAFFQSKALKTNTVLLKQSFIPYAVWLEDPLSSDVVTKPLEDESWSTIKNLYKRFLGRCSSKCHKQGTDKCEYSFAVLKYITAQDFIDNKDKLDKDFTNGGKAVIEFKCYQMPSDHTPYYDVDTSYKVGGTYQWKTKYGGEDRRMIFTHIWKNEKTYNEDGFCEECTWPYGLPDVAHTDHNYWKVGSLARYKPAFLRQISTECTKTLSMSDLGSDFIRSEPLSSPKWTEMWTKYTKYLDDCLYRCYANTVTCDGAYAVASYVDPKDVDEDWDKDVYDSFYNEDNKCTNKEKTVLFKCYSYRGEKESYLTYVDEDYQVQGTRQFRLLGAKYEADPNVLFSHYYNWIKPSYRPTPCNNCIWQFGLPDLARSNVVDERGLLWQLGTFVKDDTTFYKSEAIKDFGTARDLINLFKYTGWLGNTVNITTLTKPLDDTMWSNLEYTYKRLLAQCSSKCHELGTDLCEYAFGVMKYLSLDDVKDLKNIDPDVIDYTDAYGVAPGAYFKCYSVPSGGTYPQYTVDTSFKVRDTNQWKSTDGGVDSIDRRMVATHIWKNDNYQPVGYCDDCVWRYGLPDEAFTSYDGWKPGTLAKDKLNFMQQSSTEGAIPLVATQTIADDILLYQPLTFKSWGYLWKKYKSLLNDCKSLCRSNDNCAGANAVAGHINAQFVNEKWDKDLYEMYHDKEGPVVFKCYGYWKGKESYLTYVDEDYQVQGTRQFKTWGANYDEADLKVVYSHYWSKSNNDVTPCSECIWQYGTPDFAREDTVDERGRSWQLGTFDNSALTLFQSPQTADFKRVPYETVSIFKYTGWLGNTVNATILTKPQDDEMWSRLEYLYQRFLGRCSSSCHKMGLDKCKYAFGVLKFITKEDISDNKLDSDIRSIHGGAAVYFKCYIVPSGHKFTPYAVDKSYKISGTYQWRPQYGSPDDGMVSTHVWKNEKTSPSNGFCDSCIWPYGLPKEALAAHGEWKVGTLAKDKPAFIKQPSTKKTLVTQIMIAGDVMRYRPLAGDDFFAQKWDELWTAYTVLLDDCRDRCAVDDSCAGANAIVGSVDSNLLNENWDDDIVKAYKAIDDKRVVYKCYGYTLAEESKLANVDINNMVDGTHQYKVIDSTYPDDPKVLYSHYWSKRDYVIPTK